MRREDVGDEAVDVEVRGRRGVAGRDARADHFEEEIGAARDDPHDERSDDGERNGDRAREQLGPILREQHEKPDAEPDQPASRECRELDDEQESQ
jgi:hypothetical protein